jgi:ribonuclease P/MRP protein subunit RPP40
MLLDLSAAFDTVDLEILLQRMSTGFGIQDTAIRWFRSYLINRQQFVRLADTSSLSNAISGVPQGSVLGPLLFILYTADLIALIETHDLSAHLYADDIQIYGSYRPGNVDKLSARLSDCTTSAAAWMRSNRLQNNADKADVLWCATGRRQHQLPTSGLVVDGALVSLSASIRDLGVLLDADLSMRSQVQMTVS